MGRTISRATRIGEIWCKGQRGRQLLEVTRSLLLCTHISSTISVHPRDMFEFATSQRIVFGPGVIDQISTHVVTLLAGEGNEAPSAILLVRGKSQSRSAFVSDKLKDIKEVTTVHEFAVSGEPTVEVICEGVSLAKSANCRLVVGFGGGSVVDAGKAIAALVTNGGVPYDYMEIIGDGKPITKRSLPFIAIPTTSGTGAEVTKNAVLLSTKHRQKVSLRSPYMLPSLALVDPALTLSLPKAVTASTGLDALTQNIESYTTCKSNPLTDAIAREGIIRGAKSLRKAYEFAPDHGDTAVNDDAAHHSAREDMSLCSLFGGLALANSKLGAVHGFAGVVGGMLGTAHGTVCAMFLPYAIEVNVRVLKERDPDSAALKKFNELGYLLTGNSSATAADAVDWLAKLCNDLKVPTITEELNSAGKSADGDEVATIIAKSAKSSSMQGNPIKLTSDEILEIWNKAL